MILLGLDGSAKADAVARYMTEHEIRKVFVLGPSRFALPGHERMTDPTTQGDGRAGLFIDWPDIIQYRYFYRLLQEVDGHTLLVINECLRTQNRHDLTYNCIRNFLNQTTHQLVFQYLPLIDTIEDFMVLFDFDTRSRWKREKFRGELLGECHVVAHDMAPTFEAVEVETDAKTRADYAREKRRLIDGIGLKDPHTIPRNLHLMAGKAKLAAVEPGRAYVGRNNRFGIDGMCTYREADTAEPRTSFEFCHNFVDMCDYLAISRQVTVPALVSDLKVDGWYLSRYQTWSQRLRDGYAALHG